MKMQKLLKSTAAGITAAFITLSAPQAAEPLIAGSSIPGEFSANIGLHSEYYFRGISQTDDVPALQGGFDWSDTDLSSSECSDACGMVLMSVSRSF